MSTKTTSNNDTEAIRILRNLVEVEMDIGTGHREFGRAWDEAHAFLAIFEEGGSACQTQ